MYMNGVWIVYGMRNIVKPESSNLGMKNIYIVVMMVLYVCIQHR